MTTLANWITNDSHGISALYIASDSRACAVVNGTPTPCVLNDTYKKTFASKATPDVFGVFGIVTHAEQIIEQLIPKLPTIRTTTPLQEYGKTVCEAVSHTHPSRPSNDRFDIIHGYRMNAMNFGCSRISVQLADYTVNAEHYQLSLNPGRAFHLSWASGEAHVFTVRRDDPETDAAGLSRWQWQTFFDAIRTTGDPYSGGAPQLVALYRKWNGFRIGVFYEGKRYVAGKIMDDPKKIPNFEWRDCLFQRVDGITGELLKGAQRHARNVKPAIVSEYK